MEQAAAGPYCNKWYEKWQQAEWTNSKGEPIKDADKWKILTQEMERMAKSFIFNAGHNSYRNLMQDLAVKELKRHKSLEMIQKERQKAGV